MPKLQLDLDLIHHQANGSIIDQRAADGYINATAMCNAANKQINDYSRLKITQRFLDELSLETGIPVSDLFQSIKGGNSEHQGTWIHPQVAINLGQWLSPEFAVKVSKWIYEWMSGKGTPNTPAKMPPHLERYWKNDALVPPGYFSILQETGLSLFGPLHNVGFEVPKGWVPDISVGLLYCKWLRKEKGVDTSALMEYQHDYQDGRVVPAKLYPDEYLAEFRRWFRSVWLPENGTKYFKGKDPKSLTYLNQLPALAGPSAPKALPPPANNARRRRAA
jgi:hypothetical protein